MKNSYNIYLLFLFSIINKYLFLYQKENDNQYKSIKESKYVSIKIEENSVNNQRNSQNYSSNNFINDNFANYITTDLNLGTPSQKINSFLNSENICFQFIEKNKWKNINNKINTYIPKKSLTFLLNKNNKEKRAEDIFLFENDNIILPNKTKTNNKAHITFNLETEFGEINEESEFINDLGLNSKFSLDKKNDCPNFIKELKKNKIINKEIYSLIQKTETQGNLLIGDYLYNIDRNKYKKNNFFIINGIQNKNGIKWNINFDQIYIYDKFLEGNSSISNKSNEGKIYLPYNKTINIKIGQKIIIGTLEYKNAIDNLYFNKLIKSNICKIDITNYNSKNYYLYSCDSLKFALFKSASPYEDYYYHEPVYHYLHFPSIIFHSDKLKYDFEINYEKLFILKEERFYFMIIFEIESQKRNEEWVIGEHFIKNHIFSFNINDKKMLFYNEKLLNENLEESDIDNNDNINKENLKKEKNKNIIIILLVIVIICFIIFSFYLVNKIKKRRKKKANELIDEYEYFSEIKNNKNFKNNLNRDKNDIFKKGKNNQEIELNFQL